MSLPDRKPNDLLSAISDELEKRIRNMVVSMDSRSRFNKRGVSTLPGFPFTVVTAKPDYSPVEEEEPDPEAWVPFYELITKDGQVSAVFHLGIPSLYPQGKPPKLILNSTGLNYIFLKIEAHVQSVGQCIPIEGEEDRWIAYEEDVTTSSVTLVRLDDLPTQGNPTISDPCGGYVTPRGWGHGEGGPTADYTVYFPLVCLDFRRSSTPVITRLNNKETEFEYTHHNTVFLDQGFRIGGDAYPLSNANGDVYSVIPYQGLQPATPALHGFYLPSMSPSDSQFILRSL